MATGHDESRLKGTGRRLATRRPAATVLSGISYDDYIRIRFANEARILGKSTKIDLDEGDPPPDLWIGIDNRASSLGKLSIYAALGVPEIWRYRSRRRLLRFGRRAGDRYEPIGRSLALPMLSPALVLEAIALGDGKSEIAWGSILRERVRATLAPGGDR